MKNKYFHPCMNTYLSDRLLPEIPNNCSAICCLTIADSCRSLAFKVSF